MFEPSSRKITRFSGSPDEFLLLIRMSATQRTKTFYYSLVWMLKTIFIIKLLLKTEKSLPSVNSEPVLRGSGVRNWTQYANEQAWRRSFARLLNKAKHDKNLWRNNKVTKQKTRLCNGLKTRTITKPNLLWLTGKTTVALKLQSHQQNSCKNILKISATIKKYIF